MDNSWADPRTLMQIMCYLFLKMTFKSFFLFLRNVPSFLDEMEIYIIKNKYK